MTVLKIGGHVLNDPTALSAALDYFAALPGEAVLVHGGGARASQLLRRLGHEPRMVEGRRLTDAATLEVVTMVYAGELNTRLVAQLQARGRNALGLSGADADLIRARKRPVGRVDYGFAGDVERVDGQRLTQLTASGLTPVLCALTHDGRGQLLNTNADTIATETAIALARRGREVRLRFAFELPGVLIDRNDPASVIGRLTPTTYADHRARGLIVGGMVPKLDNAFRALAAGVRSVTIADLAGLRCGAGTQLVKD